MTQTKEWKDNWKKPNLINGLNERGYWIDNVDGIKLGERVDISKFTYLNGLNGIEIGDDVEIGQHYSILSISTIGNKEGKVKIGKGTMIGSHTTIMPNITIGENCIIGAYSYIDKNVKDFTMIIKGKWSNFEFD